MSPTRSAIVAILPIYVIVASLTLAKPIQDAKPIIFKPPYSEYSCIVADERIHESRSHERFQKNRERPKPWSDSRSGTPSSATLVGSSERKISFASYAGFYHLKTVCRDFGEF